MADGKVIIDIDGDTKEFEKSLDNLDKYAGKSAQSVATSIAWEYRRAGMGASEAMSKAWEDVRRMGLDTNAELGNSFVNLGNVGAKAIGAIAAVMATMGTSLAASVAVGSSFESQMSAVQAISGSTADTMEKLTNRAKELGIESAYSATEAGKAFEYMALAGWDAEAMINGIDGVMNLAAASGEELALVSDIVTDSMTAFGLEASKSAEFADVLAQTSARSNTNVAMLGEAFKYVAPVAGALNFTIQDTAVALGLMANSGIKGSQAGTALRATFTRLVKPTKESAEAMALIGIEATNADGTMKPLSNIIEQLRDGFEKLSPAEQAAAAGALAGQEAMSGLLAIVQASDDDFDKLTQSINESAGTAERMAEIRLDNLTGQFTLMKSSLEGVGITIYDSLQEPLTNAVKESTNALNGLNAELSESLQPSLDTLGESVGKLTSTLIEGLVDTLPILIDGFAILIDNIDLVVIAFGAFAGQMIAFKGIAIISGVVTAFGTLKTTILSAKTAQELLNIAMRSNPIGALIGAIGALVGAFATAYVSSEKFRESINGVFSVGVDTSNLRSLERQLENIERNIASVEEGSLSAALTEKRLQEYNAQKNEVLKAIDEIKNATEKQNALDVAESAAEQMRKDGEELKKLGGDAGQAFGDAGTGVSALEQELERANAEIERLQNLLNAPKTTTTSTPTTEEEEPKKYQQTQYINPQISATELAKRNKETAEKVGNSFVDDMSTGMENASETIGQGLGNAITSALSGEQTWSEAFSDMGMNLMGSLADSMMSQGLDYLSQALSVVGQFVIGGFNSIFGIASPSKVFAEMGYWNMAGLAGGIEDNSSLVGRSITGVSDMIGSSFAPQYDYSGLQAVSNPQFALQGVGSAQVVGCNTYVNVVNNSSAEITSQESTNANGEREVTLFVENTVAGNISRKGSIYQAIKVSQGK